jgi:hypothetical protein
MVSANAKARYGFLYEELKPRSYLFAVYTMGIELTLSIDLAPLLGRGPFFVLVVALLASYTLYIIVMRPFKFGVENIITLLAMAVVILAMTLSYLTNGGTAGDEPSVSKSTLRGMSIAVFVMSVTVLVLVVLVILRALREGIAHNLERRHAAQSARAFRVQPFDDEDDKDDAADDNDEDSDDDGTGSGGGGGGGGGGGTRGNNGSGKGSKNNGGRSTGQGKGAVALPIGEQTGDTASRHGSGGNTNVLTRRESDVVDRAMLSDEVTRVMSARRMNVPMQHRSWQRSPPPGVPQLPRTAVDSPSPPPYSPSGSPINHHLDIARSNLVSSWSRRRAIEDTVATIPDPRRIALPNAVQTSESEGDQIGLVRRRD